MKKFLSLTLAAVMLMGCIVCFASCGSKNNLEIATNAFFAPFEYYDGTDIVGVDVEIMAKVGEKMGKKVTFKNMEFSAIIDTVEKGTYDAGAAGITVTDARKEKVDFSTPYYTSVQYVIYAKDDASIVTKTAADGTKYIVWEALKGKKIGTQMDTTGWIYCDGEVDGDEGLLKGTGATHTAYDNAQLAADAIGKHTDVVVIDQLPAQFITSKNDKLACAPLYYAGETDDKDAPVEEQYAICVTKGNEELLKAINEVLADMMKKDADGKSQIEKMVMKHMGFDK